MSGRDVREDQTIDATLLQGLNGTLKLGQGKVFQHRLDLMPASDGDNWYIEFDDNHGDYDELPGARANKPTHTLKLKPSAVIFEGRRCPAEKFIQRGVRRQRPGSGEDPVEVGANFDDWYGDPTSRGIGC